MTIIRNHFVDDDGNEKIGHPETVMDGVIDAPFIMIKRGTVYVAGTIVYSNSLPSWGILECVQSGTTAITEPAEISTPKKKMGYIINDGTVVWLFRHRDNVRMPGEVFTFMGNITNGHPIHTRTGLPIMNWFLCDGSNGTPDLRDRMIVGSGRLYAMGGTGGNTTEIITNAQMPYHKHDVSAGRAEIRGYLQVRAQNANASGVFSVAQTGIYSDGNADDNHNDEIVFLNADHEHPISCGTSGEGQPHNNMPPYYAMAYIMVK